MGILSAVRTLLICQAICLPKVRELEAQKGKDFRVTASGSENSRCSPSGAVSNKGPLVLEVSESIPFWYCGCSWNIGLCDKGRLFLFPSGFGARALQYARKFEVRR